MKVVKQGFEILHITPGAPELIERIARVCYKSEEKIGPGTAAPLIRGLLTNKDGDIGGEHKAMIEHVHATVLWTTNRGVSHELVRHRIASYAQESTRYCNYAKDKFGKEITCILPIWLTMEQVDQAILTSKARREATGSCDVFNTPELEWVWANEAAEREYFQLVNDHKWTPQQARDVLPNCLKTDIVSTFNFSEWRHVFKLRAISKRAHPQIRDLITPFYLYMRETYPEFFGDLPLPQ